MTRIVYLHQYFCKPTMNGGVRSYEFARRLSLDGYDVHVITTDRDNSFKGWRSEEFDGFTIHWVSVKYNNKLGFFLRLWAFLRFSLLSLLKVISLKADLNIATSTPLTIAIPVLFAKLYKGTPYVFEVRDLWPAVPVELGYLNNKILIALARMLEWLAYSNASAVIALSPDMVKGVIARNISSDKVHLVPNASDVELLRNVDAFSVTSFWEKYGISHHASNIVVYTGTLGRVNKVSYLVDVASKSMELSGAINIKYVVFGDGAEKDSIIAYAEKLGVLNKSFFVFSPVQKSQLAFVLAGAKLSLSLVDNIPILWGNSANKFFDAFAAGIPIGINHAGWQADVINEHSCGVVLSHDAVVAASQIVTFLNDPAKVTHACAASAQLGDRNYNRAHLYSRFVSVIRQSMPNGS